MKECVEREGVVPYFDDGSQFVLRRLPCPLPRFRAFTRLTTAAFDFLSRLLLAPALLGVFDLR